MHIHSQIDVPLEHIRKLIAMTENNIVSSILQKLPIVNNDFPENYQLVV